MRRSLLLVVTAALMLFAAACGDNNSSPTQPVVVTPPAATPTPGGQPTPTPPPGSAATRIVNVGPGNIFMDSQSTTSTTTIKAGDTVQWHFVDSIAHSSTSGTCCTPSGLWDSGVKGSGSFSHKFTVAGTFPYYCTVHGAMMTGTVVVNP
jgi:plastocyanin